MCTVDELVEKMGEFERRRISGYTTMKETKLRVWKDNINLFQKNGVIFWVFKDFLHLHFLTVRIHPYMYVVDTRGGGTMRSPRFVQRECLYVM